MVCRLGIIKTSADGSKGLDRVGAGSGTAGYRDVWRVSSGMARFGGIHIAPDSRASACA